MARLTTTGQALTVELTRAERLWTMRGGDVSVPRSAVSSVTVADDALAAVQGVRAPGLAVPGRVKVGTWRGRWGKDLVSVRRGGPAVVVELVDAPWRRLVIGAPDRPAAEAAAEALQR